LTEESIAQQTEEWRSKPENLDQKYMTARVGGKLVGFCIVNRLSDKNQIMGFYILPSFQRQGIGHNLWEQAEVFLDPTKVTTVMVLPYNSRARKFYESLGFSETGEVANNGVGQTMASGAIMPAPIELKREAKML
jgi:ribosomal protein S18 acetylase RimI-like enzyme